MHNRTHAVPNQPGPDGRFMLITTCGGRCRAVDVVGGGRVAICSINMARVTKGGQTSPHATCGPTNRPTMAALQAHFRTRTFTIKEAFAYVPPRQYRTQEELTVYLNKLVDNERLTVRDGHICR